MAADSTVVVCGLDVAGESTDVAVKNRPDAIGIELERRNEDEGIPQHHAIA